MPPRRKDDPFPRIDPTTYSVFQQTPSMEYVDQQLGEDLLGNRESPLMGLLTNGLTLESLAAERAARHLRKFVEQAWPVVEPSVPFVGGWHIDCICEHLEAVTKGELTKLIINVPPRHSKSTLVSVMWPVWSWIGQPWSKWLCASYAESLSVRDSLRSRRVIQSAWYQSHWRDRFQLSGDQNLKSRYDNNKGGVRIASSVGGSVTGEGGDYLLCLTGNTLITTDRGQIPIDEIVKRQLDVRVLSYDVIGKKKEWEQIKAYQQRVASEILTIRLSNGKKIEATSEHPFYVERQGYITARNLRIGDRLTSVGKVRTVRQRSSEISKQDGRQEASLLQPAMFLSMAQRRTPRAISWTPDSTLRRVRQGNNKDAKSGEFESAPFLQRQVLQCLAAETTISPAFSVQGVWTAVYAQAKSSSKTPSSVLQPGVPQQEQKFHFPMRSLRNFIYKGYKSHSRLYSPFLWTDLLLPLVQRKESCKPSWGTSNLSVRSLRYQLRARRWLRKTQQASVLWPRVLLQMESRRESLGLSTWRCTESISSQLSTDNQDDPRTRRQLLSNLWSQPRHNNQGIPSSPYRLRQKQLQSGQSDNTVYQLSYQNQYQSHRLAGPTVVSVERTTFSTPVPVYNLSIATHHNYFANGVLSHNCDDPHNVQYSESELIREDVINWYTQVLSTRLNNPKTSRRVIIMQRVHELDITGFLLQNDAGYHHLVLPAEYERRVVVSKAEPQPHKGCPIYEDPRTQDGELLWPERFGEHEIKTLKAELGPYGSAGQLAQHPMPREGVLFKASQLKALPIDFDQPTGDDRRSERQRLRLLQYWDLAYSEKEKADWTVAMTGGVDRQGNLYILDVWRQRVGESNLDAEMAAVINRSGARIVGVEEAAYRQSATRDLVNRLQKTVKAARVVPVKVTADKYMRAQLPAGRMNVGMVFCDKSAPWYDDFLSELTKFPLGGNDDQVDALSGITALAVSHLSPVERPAAVQWGWRTQTQHREQWDPFAKQKPATKEEPIRG